MPNYWKHDNKHNDDKLLLTMGLILVVLLLRALFVRGLVVAQRRLALLEREKRQAAAEQKAQDAQTPPAETADTKAKPESPIFEISQQTRRLIGAATTILLVVGFWYLWSDVLPAFAKLGEHPLYTIGQDPITLGAVVTALVVTILTVIVARPSSVNPAASLNVFSASITCFPSWLTRLPSWSVP